MSEVTPFAVRDRDVTHVIIEIFGGDNNLSPFIVEDMQEMAAGNRGPFAVLALADYADRGGVVVELSPRAGNHVIEDLGEINTGDPETLATFLARALVTYGPDVRKAIGFWDHGSGAFDEQDPNQTVLERRLSSLPRYRRGPSRPSRTLFVRSARLMANPSARAMLHDDTNGGVLTNLEAEGVLKAAFNRAGMQGKADLIFSDTCLNGMIEVVEQLHDYATCIVGSEELEPGDGWEYHEWLGRMSDDPPADADQWARQAVEAFGAGYAERADQYPCTLAAFRSDNRITDSFADLVRALEARGEEGFAWVLTARSRAQSFTSDKDSSDLKDFALRLAKAAEGDTGVRTAAEALAAAVEEAAVHSVALGPTVSRASGLAFWCPATAGSLKADIDTYAHLAFDRQTGWSRYLDAQFMAAQAADVLDWSQGLDAAINLKSEGKIYFFKENQYTRLTDTKVDPNYPQDLPGGWRGLPASWNHGIDAALYYEPTEKAYFFKGSQYVRLTSTEVDPNYPQDLPGGWRGLPTSWSSGIDAAVFRDGHSYFFKGSQYVRFTGTEIDSGYPKSLPGGWQFQR